MAIDLTQSPYHDDYDESKNFHRILYRPGYPVQARELTQQQTILQNQVKRVGTHLFNEGAMIVPGDISYDDRVHFVKVADDSGPHLGSVESLDEYWLNKTIVGASNSVEAEIVAIEASDTDSEVTFYIKYTKASTDGTIKEFELGETISDVDSPSTAAIIGLESNDKGIGSSASIRDGIYFVRGYFINVYNQRVIIEKESITPTKSVGLLFTESIITVDDDSSLYDNATGTPNYAAPGANRYKLSLTLVTKELSEVTDENYIELLRIVDGEVVKKVDRTSFNIIGDELASRTYDESGNYTVKPFVASVEEHLTDTSKLNVVLEPGKAFVRGYEIRTLGKTRIPINKATELAYRSNISIDTEIGNYIQASNLRGAPLIREYSDAELYDTLTETPHLTSGNKVGTAKIRSVKFYTGTPNAADGIYKLFLFDISLDAGKTFRDVKQIYQLSNISGVGDFTADVGIHEQILSGSVSEYNGANTLKGFSTRWKSIDNERLRERDIIKVEGITSSGPDTSFGYFRVNSIVSDNELNVTAILGTSTAAFGPGESKIARLLSGSLEETIDNTLLFLLPNSRINKVRDKNDEIDTSFVVNRFFEESASGGGPPNSVGINVTLSGEEFNSSSEFDYIVYNYDTNSLIDLTDGNITFTVTNTNVNISDSSGTLIGDSHQIAIIAPIRKYAPTGIEAAPKEKQKNLLTDTLNVGASDSKKEISLQKADILEIVSILENGSDDVSDRYDLDDGQRDNFYDIGKLYLIRGKPEPEGTLDITFKYFEHVGIGDYFSRDSYDIPYADIPSYQSTNTGNVFDLSDVLDFRPVIGIDGSGVTGFDKPNASLSEIPTERTILDYSFFLPRIDKLYLDTRGNFNIIEGSSAVNPTYPDEPTDGMVLYDIGLSANTLSPEDVLLQYRENKRYTMRDIGKLEDRIETLEYYTELTLLEKETADLEIKDADGLDRFKNGFIVDPFDGHGVGNVLDSNYKCSIDMNQGECRPRFQERNVSFQFNETDSSSSLVKKTHSDGSVLLIDYDNELLIDQPLATSAINVNPFNVFNFLGTIGLNPKSDQWKDEKVITKLHTDSSLYDSLKASTDAMGTFWKGWDFNWSGEVEDKKREVLSEEIIKTHNKKQRKRRVKRRKKQGSNSKIAPGRGYQLKKKIVKVTGTEKGNLTAEGFRLKAEPKVLNRKVDERVVNMAYLETMRSIDIKFEGKAFKPSTKLYPFFDDIDVSDYISLRGERTVEKTDLTTTTFTFPDFYVGAFRISEIGNVFELVTLQLDALGGGATTINFTESNVLNTRWTITGKVAGSASSGHGSILRCVGVVTPGNNPTLQFVYDKKVGVGVADDDFLSSIIDSDIITVLRADNVSSDSTMKNPGLLTDETGKIDGAFRVPNPTDFQTKDFNVSLSFPTGTRQFKLTDDINNSTDSTTEASATFFAEGLLETKQRDITSVIGADIQQVPAEDVNVEISRTVTDVKVRKKWVDPVAQSFLVTDPGGIFVSEIHLYFRTKDANIPVMLEIRETQVGLPGSLVVPYSSVVVDSNNVHTNRVEFDTNNNPIKLYIDDVEQTTIAPSDYNENFVATVFTFDIPVYLKEGAEYAFVVMANSDKYEIWRAKAALTNPEPKIGTNTPISENPYAGSMFKSQNASTWTPEQESDLMFKIYRAKFTSENATAVFENIELPLIDLDINPFEMASTSTKVRIRHPHHGFSDGSKVLIDGVIGVYDSPSGIYLVNGIPVSELNTEHTISDVTLNSYTITVTTPATHTAFGGGSFVQATNNIAYETLKLMAETILLPDTDIIWSLTATTRKHPFDFQGNQVSYGVDGPFNVVVNDDIEFDSPRIIATSSNEREFLSSNKSLKLEATLFRNPDKNNISPVIELDRLSAIAVASEIDSPALTGDGAIKIATFDDIDLTAGGPFTLTFSPNGNEGTIDSLVEADAIELNQITEGNHFTVSGTSSNNGEYILLTKEFTPESASVKIRLNVVRVDNASISSETVATNIVYYKEYINELSPTGGSSSAKYITRHMVLSQPAVALRISVTASVQTESDIEVYYKIQTDDADVFDSLPYQQATLDDTPTVSEDEDDFRDYVFTEDDLPDYTAFSVKVVMKGSNPSKPPLLQDLRAIALGT